MKRLTVTIIFLLMLLVVCLIHAHGQCTITQGTQIPVNSGATPTLTASGCGTGLVWSKSGQGSINSSTGVYTAPAHVAVQHTDRGCQVSPNNSPFNIPVDASDCPSCTVDPHSLRWLARAAEDGPEYTAYHNLKVIPELTNTFWDNPINSNTSLQQFMHFNNPGRSIGYQDTYFPFPSLRKAMMECGTFLGEDGPYMCDRHIFTMDYKGSGSGANTYPCSQSEIYYTYPDYTNFTCVPSNPTQCSWSTKQVWPIPNQSLISITGLTGPTCNAMRNNSWTCANGSNQVLTISSQTTGTLPINSTGFGTLTGTPLVTALPPATQPQGTGTQNAAGGQQFQPGNYALQAGEDAASMCIGCLSPDTEEWFAAVQNGASDLGHAIRTTMNNAYLSARNQWPATAFANSTIAITAATATNPVVLTANQDITPQLLCDMYGYYSEVNTMVVATGGSGYHVNDSFVLTGGGSPGGTASGYVTSVSGTTVTGVAIVYRGYGYVPGTFTTINSVGSGSGLTVNITGNTNCQFNINVSGGTGNWAAINGDQLATSINGNRTQFTIPVNGTGFGTFTHVNPLFVPDFFPYGATLRCKSTFNTTLTGCSGMSPPAWCAYATVYLNTCKKYGLVVSDGTYPPNNWFSSVMVSELFPKDMIDAAIQIGLQVTNIEGNLEVVQRSSQMVTTGNNPSNLPLSWQNSNVNRTTVTVTGSSGTATSDIILQGATVGTDRERFTQIASSTWTPNVWCNGDAGCTLSFAIDTGISGSSINSSTGAVTMPNCAAQARGLITVTDTNDASSTPLYIEVHCLPVGGDGSWRLAIGNYTGNFTDSGSNVWYGASANYGFNNSYERIGGWGGPQDGSLSAGNDGCTPGSWSGTDYQLKAYSASQTGDIYQEVVGLANGTYTITFYGEPGYGTCRAGSNVFDIYANNTLTEGYIDGYNASGSLYHGYTKTFTATVVDGVLDVAARARYTAALASNYGISVSSLEITPASSPPPQNGFLFSR